MPESQCASCGEPADYMYDEETDTKTIVTFRCEDCDLQWTEERPLLTGQMPIECEETDGN